jgi:PhzF family phenazine biosynthesis protein
MPDFPFRQLDVFAEQPLRGNPLAVVLDADGLDDATMRRFAAWTNLSETTFLLPPSPEGVAAGADYRVRIFTPETELPFAGHPTLGSAQAWLLAGNAPRGDTILQECGVGLVPVRRDGERLAFRAPPLRRQGPLEPALLERLLRAFGLEPHEVAASSWIENGPPWVGLLLRSRARLLALRPALGELDGVMPGLIAPFDPAIDGTDAQFEVRGFVPNSAVPEDPVTGSLNAGLAQWLIGAALAPDSYVASQGTVLGRAGRVHVSRDGADIWVGGRSVSVIEGRVAL